MSLGIWYEALMRWVGEASRVMAMSKVFVKQRKDEATGRLAAVCVPEHVDIIADLVCGAQAHLPYRFLVEQAIEVASESEEGDEDDQELVPRAACLPV